MDKLGLFGKPQICHIICVSQTYHGIQQGTQIVFATCVLQTCYGTTSLAYPTLIPSQTSQETSAPKYNTKRE
jgi:hypothetical protein